MSDIVISNPIHIFTDDPEPDIYRVQQFLGASQVEYNKIGPKIDDFYLVGPQCHESVSHILNRFGISYSIPANDSTALAWGLWMSPNAEIEEAPLVQTFLPIPELTARPVMTSEHRLRAAELIVVPKDSESFVVVTSVDGGALSDDIKWFMWLSEDGGFQPEISKALPHLHHPPAEPETKQVIEGRLICAAKPWLGDSHADLSAGLTQELASFQLTPILNPEDAAELAQCISSGPWARRVGDIYTQDALDIVSWSQSQNCPQIVKRVVKLVQEPNLVNRVAGLTGVQVQSLREVFAYRLRANDRILVHADTTYGGELFVRVNWLIQAPDRLERPWDFRFWNPAFPDIPPTVYSSISNRAVFFLFGEDNPHDVPVIPEGAVDRINIVISFGKAK